ncbi:MAG: dihydroneopterin triphosphate diphosphatase [Gammaproteobacteria bacterium]|nr:dihydroneopterin triphosphate diphosphatase [Gammaproteobacteria bacterium]
MNTRFKRPESVLVVIYCRTDVLVMQRKDDPNFWQSVTGSLEWDETHDSAAVRELFEETGIDQQPIYSGQFARFVVRESYRHKYGTDQPIENIEYIYHCEMCKKPEIALSPDEHTAFEWLPWPQAAERCWSPSNREAILALFNAS